MILEFLNLLKGFFHYDTTDEESDYDSMEENDEYDYDSMEENDEYDLAPHDWNEAMIIAANTQRRLDNVIEYNEVLYKRAKNLSTRSRQLRNELFNN